MWGSPGTILAGRELGLDVDRERDWLARSGRRRLWTQRLYGGRAAAWARRTASPAACSRSAAVRVAETLATLAVEEDGLVNWRPSQGRELDGNGDGLIRAQWCHGAPGIVATLAPFMRRAGPGGRRADLARGPAGQGRRALPRDVRERLRLLALLERTGDERWLGGRAPSPCMRSTRSSRRERLLEGRYTLWTGDLGPRSTWPTASKAAAGCRSREPHGQAVIGPRRRTPRPTPSGPACLLRASRLEPRRRVDSRPRCRRTGSERLLRLRVVEDDDLVAGRRPALPALHLTLHLRHPLGVDAFERHESCESDRGLLVRYVSTLLQWPRTGVARAYCDDPARTRCSRRGRAGRAPLLRVRVHVHVADDLCDMSTRALRGASKSAARTRAGRRCRAARPDPRAGHRGTSTSSRCSSSRISPPSTTCSYRRRHDPLAPRTVTKKSRGARHVADDDHGLRPDSAATA